MCVVGGRDEGSTAPPGRREAWGREARILTCMREAAAVSGVLERNNITYNGEEKPESEPRVPLLKGGVCGAALAE